MKEKPDIVDIIERKRLQWYDHVKRMQDERLPKLIMEWIPGERRKRGRPRKTWNGRCTSSHENKTFRRRSVVNPLNPELNPICYLLALLAHHFLHVSSIRVKSLIIRLLMSHIYGAPILDVSRSHTTTHHSR